jgi:hypothetical protein
VTRLSETLGPPLHQDHGDPSSTPTVYRAEVTAVSGGLATVVLPSFSRVNDFAGVPFMPRGATDVAPGDEAWVAFDDERSPVIVCWRPA